MINDLPRVRGKLSPATPSAKTVKQAFGYTVVELFGAYGQWKSDRNSQNNLCDLITSFGTRIPLLGVLKRKTPVNPNCQSGYVLKVNPPPDEVTLFQSTDARCRECAVLDRLEFVCLSIDTPLNVSRSTGLSRAFDLNHGIIRGSLSCVVRSDHFIVVHPALEKLVVAL